MTNLNKSNNRQVKPNSESIMRILANHLIDRFLEDKKNNRLKLNLKPSNINLDLNGNHGTH